MFGAAYMKVFQTTKSCYVADVQRVTGYAEPQFRVHANQFSTHLMKKAQLFFSYPKTHFRFTNALVNIKKRIKNPSSLKIIVPSHEKLEIFLEYAFYFPMI